MWDAGITFDYVSDLMLEDVGFEDGALRAGKIAYDVVLVPHARLMPLSTMKQLFELTRSGATIVFTGGVPADVPGLGNLEARRALAWGLGNAPRQDLMPNIKTLFLSGDVETRRELLRATPSLLAPTADLLAHLVELLVEPRLRSGVSDALVAMGTPALVELERLLLSPETPYALARELPPSIARFSAESAAEVPKDIKGKPWGRLGVDTEGEFKPYYVVPADKKKYVQQLKAALKDASEVILATDPDREGESISWHLKEVLKPKVRVRRIVFHEITEDAIKDALREAHEDVDENLVRAQESRRILDRLYGYTLSPVLWKKVQTGLSAGRVQSVERVAA